MKDPRTRFGWNALWMILSRFGGQGLAVVFTILLARRLGSSSFGEYAFVVAVIFVANALTTFGTDMLLIREIAAKGDLSRLPIALMVQLVLSSLFIVAMWIFSNWIPNQSPETITALKIYSLALIPLAFFSVFTTALRGVQRMDMYSLLTLIVSALQVGVVLVPNISIVRLSVLLLLVQSMAALFAGFLCPTVIPHFGRLFRLSSSTGTIPFLLSSRFSSLVSEAAPIAWLALLGMIYQRLSIYLLSTMSGAMETGIYSAGFRVVEASKTAHLATFAALYPAMAEARDHWSSSPAQNERAYRDQRIALRYLLVAAIFITLILFILSKPLVLLFYGDEFSVSAGVLQILAWMLIPFAINTYLTLSFLVSNKESLIGRALTVSLLALLILNMWWIPAKGPEGSAWAALIAECIQSVFLLAGTRSRVDVRGEVHEFPNLP